MANYQDLRKICLEIAIALGPPIFYTEKEEPVEQSRMAFEKNETVQKCLGIVAQEGFFAGHAEVHIRNVSIDAGAIVLIEANGSSPIGKIGQRLSFLAHIAGVLHDIKRSQPEHARLGALEAERILKRFDLEETEQQMIVKAIANHEAFQPSEPLQSSEAQLLSDALYDADKFQWGPENFTENPLGHAGLTKERKYSPPFPAVSPKHGRHRTNPDHLPYPHRPVLWPRLYRPGSGNRPSALCSI